MALSLSHLSLTMQQENSENMQDAHRAKEEAVLKPTVRIVGTFVLSVYFLSAENILRFLGISVGQIVHDKKPVYIKLKLDGAPLDNLPAIGPKPTPERREWSVSL